MSSIRHFLGIRKRAMEGWWDNLIHGIPASGHFESEDGMEIIGYSAKGYRIPAVKIGNGSKNILFVSGIHGNEVGTIKLAKKLIPYLRKQKQWHEKFTFQVIPCLNPEGVELAIKNPDYLNGGLIGRFNGNNVDLNRNFDTSSFQMKSSWGRGKDYQEQIPVFCGDAPASEPETKALVKYIREIRPELYFAFHSVRGGILANKFEPAQKAAELFSKTSGYILESDEEWQTLSQTGTAYEWCTENNIPYLEIEGRYRWSADWRNHRRGIQSVLKNL